MGPCGVRAICLPGSGTVLPPTRSETVAQHGFHANSGAPKNPQPVVSHDRPASALLDLPHPAGLRADDGLSGLRIEVGRQATLSKPASHHVPTLTMVHSPEQLRPQMFTAIVANDHRRRNSEYN